MKKILLALSLSALTVGFSPLAFAADEPKAAEPAKDAAPVATAPASAPPPAAAPAATSEVSAIAVVEMAGMKYYIGHLVKTNDGFALEAGDGDKKLTYTLNVPEMFDIALKNTHKVNAERNPKFAIAGSLEEKDGKKTLSLQAFMLEDQLKEAMKIMDATKK